MPQVQYPRRSRRLFSPIIAFLTDGASSTIATEELYFLPLFVTTSSERMCVQGLAYRIPGTFSQPRLLDLLESKYKRYCCTKNLIAAHVPRPDRQYWAWPRRYRRGTSCANIPSTHGRPETLHQAPRGTSVLTAFAHEKPEALHQAPREAICTTAFA